ncbi:MAG: type II toxin-antitoxin system RnlA family toxin [Lachnospiraceae bacterium]
MPDDKKYKGLQVNISNVPGWVEAFCSQKSYRNIEIQKKDNKQSVDYEIKHSNGSFSFSFFKSSGDRYTLSYKRGKNFADSKEFADFVVDRLGSVNRQADDNSGYKIHITLDEFIAFMELIIDDDIKILAHTDNERETQYKLKSIQYSDEIRIHYYKTTENVFIQGRRLQLFNKATDILAGTCDFVDVVNAEIRYDKVDISSDQVIDNMKDSLGAVYDFLTRTQKAIMSSAFKFYRVDIDLDDYSPMVQPMCRAMEGFIYNLLKFVGVDVTDEGVGYFFRSEDEKYDPLKLKERFVSEIDNDAIVRELNKLYHWYHNNRNQYSHSRDTDFSTAIIEKREIADTKFKEAVDLYRTVYDAIVEEKRK